MEYTIFENAEPIGVYAGVSGEDSHGQFILFPLDLSDIATPGKFVKNESGEMYIILETTYAVVNDLRALKVYY